MSRPQDSPSCHSLYTEALSICTIHHQIQFSEYLGDYFENQCECELVIVQVRRSAWKRTAGEGDRLIYLRNATSYHSLNDEDKVYYQRRENSHSFYVGY